jgi:hypothetical protein
MLFYIIFFSFSHHLPTSASLSLAHFSSAMPLFQSRMSPTSPLRVRRRRKEKNRREGDLRKVGRRGADCRRAEVPISIEERRRFPSRRDADFRRAEAPISIEQRRRFLSSRGADCGSRVIVQWLKGDFRRNEIFCGFFLSWPIWCVICSGVSNFSCVCVGCVVNFRPCVCV